MVAAERQLLPLDEATILTQYTLLIYFTCPTQVDIWIHYPTLLLQ